MENEKPMILTGRTAKRYQTDGSPEVEDWGQKTDMRQQQRSPGETGNARIRDYVKVKRNTLCEDCGNEILVERKHDGGNDSTAF